MTVQELIEKLKEFPLDADVIIDEERGYVYIIELNLYIRDGKLTVILN